MKKNKKNIKILTATGMCLFSLVAVFTATIAWFAAQKKVNASGMSLKVKTPGTSFSKMTIHRCMFNESSSSTYVFNPTPEFEISSTSTDNGTFEMLDYDKNESALNRSQPVLLLFELDSASADSVSLSAAIGQTTYPLAVSSSNVNNYPFSHAVQFQSIGGESSFSFSIPTSNLSSMTSFAYQDSGTWKLRQRITLYQGSGTGPLKYVGVVMDYYDAALTYVISSQNSASTTILNSNGRLGFYCDWTMII